MGEFFLSVEGRRGKNTSSIRNKTSGKIITSARIGNETNNSFWKFNKKAHLGRESKWTKIKLNCIS